MKTVVILLASTALLLIGCSGAQSSSGGSGDDLASRKLVTLTKAQENLYVAITSASGRPSLAVDSKGNIYYPNTDNSKVGKIDTNGIETTFAGDGTQGTSDGVGTSAQIRPSQLAIDRNDNLYVHDTFNKFRKITPDGTVTTLGTLAGANYLRAMTVDDSGNIYFTEDNPSDSHISIHVIKKFSNAGVLTTFAGSGVAGNIDGNSTTAMFNGPEYLAADSQGNIYVSDANNRSIRKITPAGNVTTFAGNGTKAVVNGTGMNAQFFFYGGLSHLAFDSNDTLYVGDMAGSTGYIRTIDKNGVVSTFCGNGSTNINVSANCAETGLWVNGGLAIDRNGYAYYLTAQKLFRVGK